MYILPPAKKHVACCVNILDTKNISRPVKLWTQVAWANQAAQDWTKVRPRLMLDILDTVVSDVIVDCIGYVENQQEDLGVVTRIGSARVYGYA